MLKHSVPVEHAFLLQNMPPASFALAVGDSNRARSAYVKKHILQDCQARRASAHLRFPHLKYTLFHIWIVRRSFCSKFTARQGKSADNTDVLSSILTQYCEKFTAKTVLGSGLRRLCKNHHVSSSLLSFAKQKGHRKGVLLFGRGSKT